MAGRHLFSIGLTFLLAQAAQAQVTEPRNGAEVAAVESSQTQRVREIPAGTIVSIRLEEAVSSRTARNDDMFPISLLTPIELNGEVIVPAGTRGMGQVVHAAPRGFGGRAGELILAARYLQWGERRIPLRGMRISTTGRNNTAEAIILSSALVGMFVTGTSADLEIGHEGIARLSEALVLDQGDGSAPANGVTQVTGEDE